MQDFTQMFHHPLSQPHQSDYGMLVTNLVIRKAVVLLSQCRVCCFFFSFLFSLSVIGADAGNGIRVFIPDIGMFVAGLVIWLLCRSLVQKRPPEDMAQYNADFDAEEQVSLFCSFTFFSPSWLLSVAQFQRKTEMSKKWKTETQKTHIHVCTHTRSIWNAACF